MADPEFEFPDSPKEDPIEPGRPSLENVLFVLLGAASTLWVFYHLATLFG